MFEMKSASNVVVNDRQLLRPTALRFEPQACTGIDHV